MRSSTPKSCFHYGFIMNSAVWLPERRFHCGSILTCAFCHSPQPQLVVYPGEMRSVLRHLTQVRNNSRLNSNHWHQTFTCNSHLCWGYQAIVSNMTLRRHLKLAFSLCVPNDVCKYGTWRAHEIWIYAGLSSDSFKYGAWRAHETYVFVKVTKRFLKIRRLAGTSNSHVR